jgi:hypothetical protein
VAIEQPRLKLGKSAAFVKTQIKRLPQVDESWEADFQALPRPAGQTDTHYLGLVVGLPKGDPLVYMPVEYPPTVNELADLLADALRRPLTGSARRPQHLHLRGNPRWEELFPHLKEIGVDVSIQDDLPKLEIVHEDFLRQMRKGGAGLRIVYFPGPPPVADQFPAISTWVREHGRIEVGRRQEGGFVARAFDDTGLVFDNNGCDTLDEAMTALEEGLTGRFKDHESALRSSSPKSAKTQRRLPHDG